MKPRLFLCPKKTEITVLSNDETFLTPKVSSLYCIKTDSLMKGDVHACRRVGDSRVGNVFESSISDLRYHQMEEYREFRQFKKCADCELLPWCRGCPAVAKELMALDPQCWKVRNNVTGKLL